MNNTKITELYDSLKPYVWVLEVEGTDNKQYLRAPLTGFGVKKEGMLMTCAHGRWHKWSNLKILAKPLSSNECYIGYAFHRRADLDITLIQLKGPVDGETLVAGQVKDTVTNPVIPTVTFASGNLEVGEAVMLMGHPYSYVGSGMVGQVVFPCVDSPILTVGDVDLICKDYPFDGLEETPKYRVMGDIWNSEVFKRIKDDPYDKRDLYFEKQLQAQIPIVHCKNLVAGQGSSGGPLFNLKGEVVGMHVQGLMGHEISIHCSQLKQIRDANIQLKPIRDANIQTSKSGQSSRSNKSLKYPQDKRARHD